MATDTDLKRISESTSLPLSDIQKGLSHVWQEAARASEGGEGPTATRVCTLSLVVYVADRTRLDEVIESIQGAAQVHSLRSIVLTVEPEAEETSTEGQVAGYCRISEVGNVQVCCEQIMLDIKGPATGEIEGAVDGVLMPDLPVVLWWVGESPFQDRIFSRIELLPDYVIVDSKCFADPVGDLRRIIGEISGVPHPGVGDLNWSRIIQWRELAAGLFDNRNLLPYLGQIDSLDIEYADGSDANPVQALLYAGWFASRLNWTPAGGSSEDGTYDCTALRADGSEVKVSIKPVQAEGLSLGDLRAMKVDAGGGKAHCNIEVNIGSHQIEGVVQVEGTPDMHRTTSYRVDPTGKLVASQLDVMSLDAIYQQSLSTGMALTTGSR